MAKNATAFPPADTSPLRITTGDFLIAGIPACAAGFFMALAGGASGPGVLAGAAIGGAFALLAVSTLFAYGSWLRARRAVGAGRAAFRWTAIILASGSLFTSCSDLSLRANARSGVAALNAALSEYVAISQGEGDTATRRAHLRDAHERRLSSRGDSRTSTLDLTVPMAEAAWESSLRGLRFEESLDKLLAMPGVGAKPARTGDDVTATLVALAELDRDLETAANTTTDLRSIVDSKLRESGVPERTVQAVLDMVGTPSAAQIAEQSARWSPVRRYAAAMRGWLGYLHTHRGRWRYDDGESATIFDPGLGAEARKLIDTLSQAGAAAFGNQVGG